MAHPPIAPSNRAALAASIVAVAAVYLLAGKLGLALAQVNTSTTAVWPPTGIAIAALLLLGRAAWPGVALGAFGVNLTTTGEVFSSIGIATGNTLEALIGAHLVAAFAKGARAFDRPQDVFKFAFLAAFLAPVVSATIGTSSLTVAGLAAVADFGAIWATWWLGDASGALVVAPVLLTWATGFDLRSIASRAPEKLLLLGAVGLTGSVLFGGIQGLTVGHNSVAFLSFPVLIWAAYRFGPLEATLAVMLLAGIADWGTIQGHGPFARGDPNESLLLLQAFMGVAAVTTDVLAAALLDRQRAEERSRATEHQLRVLAEESARIREEFLAIATHELRTPVTGLRGFVQLAQQALGRGQTERARATLDTALRQSDRLGALIAQLLDASQAHAGSLAIEPVPTDLTALVSTAVEGARLRSGSHRWVVEVAPGLRANLDPLRFEQVVVNLLDNAVKFSPSGGTIAAKLTEGDGVARLEISDQGIGIAPDRIGYVFERFYRAHEDRGLGGLGLGLYITRQIVERHGGNITVTSRPGRGTTFTVVLPLTTAELPPQAAEPSPPLGERRGRVLVIDDDADIRALVAQVLRDTGVSVATAADGNEALAETARADPDVIILDKIMPNMNGTDFAAAYRACGGAAPIIAFCAARDAPQWAASIGAVSYLGKPFDVAELERLVLAELPATA